MKQATVELPSGEYLISGFGEPVKTVKYDSTVAFGNYLDAWYHDGSFFATKIPLGNWQLLGADPTALTEEEAQQIIEEGVCFYYDYIKKDYTIESAPASLDSLAASLGISKPYVILKNVEK